MSAHLPPTTFIIGAARSGTSLLYKVLCLHPESAYFDNWLRRMPGLPAVTIANRVARHTPRTRRRVWFGADSNAYAYSRSRGLAERLYPVPVEGEPVFVRCGVGQAVGATTPRHVRSLRRVVVGTVRWGGGTHFINKRIANNRRIELLARTFPGCRFVDLTRDGRAVALSLSRVDWWEPSNVWWYGGTPADWRKGGGDPWELCARNWVEEVRAIDAGLKTVAEERVLRVTYEDLVAEPRTTLRRIASFIGLDDDPRWLDALDGLSFPDKNRTWAGQLSPAALATIEAVQRPELDRRGYQ